LHFDFVWDERKGKELGLQQIWRDDKFTTCAASFRNAALYELKDGKGSLINFDFNNGLYTLCGCGSIDASFMSRARFTSTPNEMWTATGLLHGDGQS